MMTVIKEGKKYVRMEIIDRYYIKDKPISIDIWSADDETEYKFSKWLKNLDKGHAIGLMIKAREKGLKLSTKGLYENEKLIPVKTFVELKKILI